QPAVVTVTDDESPALRVILARKLVAEGLPQATTGTVLRNTGTTGALVVALASSDPTEATVPPEVTIADGRNSATFTVSSVSDNQPDGNQTVTITAAAAGYVSGADTLVVSDTDLPDLFVESLTVPAAVDAEAYFDIGCRVMNQGLGPAQSSWTTRVFLSRDPVVGDDLFLGEYVFSGTLPVGQSFGQTFRTRAPLAVGQYWIVVSTDVGGAVAETLEDNNTTVSAAPIEVQAPYQATVETEVTAAMAGTPVPLRGRAFRTNNLPAASALVHLHVTLRGATRVYAAMTDADGNFATTFQPHASEAGRYTLGATHPGVSTAAVQDSFDLLGFRANPAWASVAVAELGTVSGSVQLVNLGELPLSGLTASVVDQPANLTVALSVDNGRALPGSGTITLGYTITANDASLLSGMVNARVTSAEGATVNVPLYVTVEPLRARLVADPDSLRAGLTRGRQRVVEFDVVNQGGLASGPITVSLPPVAWMQLASTNPLPTLAPGETNRVSLVLTPPNEVTLGVHRGTLVLDCTSASLGVPLEFRILSDARGDLLVAATDEYTFYAEGEPKVTNATVTVTDSLTGARLGAWLTDAQGQVRLTNLLESYYAIEVTAPQHSAYRATLFLEPGQTNTVDAFLARQAVRYTWTVVPTEVEDRTRIVIETEFETYVPMPVVTLEPALVDLSDETNSVVQLQFTLQNHGLIAAENVEFQIGELAGWRFTPLIEQVGTLPAMTSLVIPVVAERTAPGLRGARGGDEDCWSWTKALYEVLCRQYRNRKEVKAWLHDDKQCPPPKPPPTPPSIPTWVYGFIGPTRYPPGGATSPGAGTPQPT
ncbi:MAG TPA: CARDB domain-containing protein, partial [Verrucomicrobiae bacterium]